MKNNLVKSLVRNSIVAAIYFLLTLITFPISFGLIQVRISEALVLLCFFNPEYAIGVTIGCLLSNAFGPGNLGVLDIVFGTLATLISCVLVSLFKSLLISAIFPIVINGFVIGAILKFTTESLPYFALVGFVALGELIAILIGFILMSILRKNEHFMELIGAKKH